MKHTKIQLKLFSLTFISFFFLYSSVSLLSNFNFRISRGVHGANNNHINKNNNNNENTGTNFSKGSLIELPTGELKRVEDMRAEDFVTSSKKNPDLQLIDTTVVKVMVHPQCATITFTFNNSKVRFDHRNIH